MPSKKSIYELREEMIRAQAEFLLLRINSDSIKCVFAYQFETTSREVSNKIKSYIETRFDDIISVILSANYLTVYHRFVLIDHAHRGRRG